MANTRKLHYKTVNDTAEAHIGQSGEIFYDPETPALRVGNGVDAGGVQGVVAVKIWSVHCADAHEYTLLPSDNVIIVDVNWESGVTVILPSHAVMGKQYTIKRDPHCNGYHSVHIEPGGCTTIDGDDDTTREWRNGSATFTYAGYQRGWYITSYSDHVQA